MGRDRLDRARIEVYENGQFRGYVKSVSEANFNVVTILSKQQAKTYASQEAVNKEVEKIMRITNGAYTCLQS